MVSKNWIHQIINNFHSFLPIDTIILYYFFCIHTKFCISLTSYICLNALLFYYFHIHEFCTTGMLLILTFFSYGKNASHIQPPDIMYQVRGRNSMSVLMLKVTRSSADADNRLDAFSSQSRSTNIVPFSVHCDFSLSM